MSSAQGTSKLLYKLNDNPGFWRSSLLAVQHIILVFSGSVLMPVVICRSTGTSLEQTEYIIFATTIVTAISSFIQVKRFGRVGSGYLLFMGSNAAYWGAIATTVELEGWSMVATLTILSAPVEFIVSYFYRYLRKVITPMVGGVVIMIIALSLLPIMMSLWTGQPDEVDYCSPLRLALGGITLLVTLLVAFSRQSKLRLWSILIGIGVGVLIALFTGYMDFNPISEQKWVGLPRGSWPGFSFEFSTQALSLLGLFMMATLASTVESIGDAISVQQVSQPNFRKVDYKSVQGCLNSDGVGNMLGGLFGTVPNTTYSGNIAAIEITGVASRRVGYYAAVILVLMAFFPKIAYFIAYIPDPVLGGANILFISMLLYVGMQLINREASTYRTNLIVSISLAAGLLASLGLLFPDLMTPALNIFFTNGIAVGGMVAILLSAALLVFQQKPQKIRLSKQDAILPDLNDWTQSVSRKKGLSGSLALKLNLVAEELFTFMAKESQNGVGYITFRAYTDDEHIHLEVNDKADIEDMDTPIESDTAIKTIPDKLGLMLVQKLAAQVEHQRISGHNYIHLKLALEV